MSKQQLQIVSSSLQGALATGRIDLPISAGLVVSSNDVPNLAASGGKVAKDSDPILERSNGATDKSLRLSWASASVIEAHFGPISWPNDLDPAQPVKVKIQAAMKSGSVNVPVIAVGAFEGVGGSNLGGNTAALSTSIQTLSVSLTVTGYPGFLNISLKPAAHATASNDVYVYAAWLEFSKKA